MAGDSSVPRPAASSPSRGRIRSRLRVRGVDLVAALDVVAAGVIFLIDNAWLASENHHHAGRRAGLLLVIVALLTALPLVLRDRRPLAAWISSAAAIAISAAIVVPHHDISSAYVPGSVAVYVLCLYSVAVRGGNGVTVTAAGVTVFGAAALDQTSAAIAVPAMIPLVLGHLVRLRRSTRRRLAEQEARHEAETAVLQERQRIARELHDVVAHHMSVIAIQAEAAPYKVADPPPELAESFADIRASALEGLTELRRVLGVLRAPDGGTPQTAPQPGLERLEEVLASARTAGLSVEVMTTGEAATLPQGVALSAHRILQEALSNAMKHAPGASVRVEIGYTPGALRLRVVNGPGTEPRPVAESGGGHGLVGMRERVIMLGGELSTGPEPGGGFAVAAVLPFQKAPT